MDQKIILKTALKLSKDTGQMKKIQILKELSNFPKNTNIIAHNTGIAYSHAAKFLKYLKELGLVDYYKDLKPIEYGGNLPDSTVKVYHLTQIGNDFVEAIREIDL